MAVPENIEQLVHEIRNAIFGRDVREAIASSIEATADVADWSRQVAQQIVDGEFDEGKLATEIENKLNQLEQDYAPKLTGLENEIEEARGNSSNLASRLNDFSSQLAEKAKQSDLGDITELGHTARNLTIQVKETMVNIKNFGAIGDWDGSTGTDNSQAFKDALDSVSSGKIFFPEGDYYFSERLEIQKNNITLEIPENTTIRTTQAPDGGETVVFRGLGDDTTEEPTMKNGRVLGKGKIIAPGSNNNAIGFVRCKGCFVDGLTLSAGHKAVTTQSYNEDIDFKNIHILEALTSGVALETHVRNAKLNNIQIDSCGKGIHITGGLTPRAKNININGVFVDQSTDDGLQASTTDELTITNLIFNNIGGRGISLDNSKNIALTNFVLKNVSRHGINTASLDGTLNISNGSLHDVGLTENHHGIRIIDILDYVVSGVILKGDTHRYSVVMGNGGGNNGVFMGNNFQKGYDETDRTQYFGNLEDLPKIVYDIYGGEILRRPSA